MEKIIYNKLIPFKGFTALNLFGYIFIREEYHYLSNYYLTRVIQHENIHTAQMMDFSPKFFPRKLKIAFGGVIFYIVYFIEWIYRLIFHFNTAYKGISFEKEAYYNEINYGYLESRKRFNQWRR